MAAQHDLELLTEAAARAAEIALGYFGHDPEAWTKAGNSPVSEADLAVDRYLFDVLRTARPDYGWLSEETADSAERLDRKRIFVVDPIDGTRAFLAGKPDWCVSVAVVEGDRPVAGVLAVPVHREFYAAIEGAGATLNGKPITASGRASPLYGARMSGPLWHQKIFAAAGVDFGETRLVPSLAYRFALVAAGHIDLATATPDAHDWDLAAADLLVHEAGALLADLTGARIRYNQPDPRHPALIAASPDMIRAAAPILSADAESGQYRRQV